MQRSIHPYWGVPTATVAALGLALTASTALSYAGIPFAPRAAAVTLQGLTRRSEASDHQSQMELNIQHEEGGAFDNLEPAGRVYRAAVSSSSSPFHTVGVQAESKMGRRRIIQYLLSPISQALDEGGRGR